MERIGLIGAPGAGKSDLAYRLSLRLDPKDAYVVDEYIPEIEGETDLVLGFYATYIGNLYAALGRFARERIGESAKPDYLITCGTLIENQLYAAADGADNERYADVPEEHNKRTVVSMQILGLFMQDLFLYDHLFYLPYEDERAGYLASFDENLPLAIELWGIKATKLTGTIEEKLDVALSALSEVPSGTDTSS